MFRPCTFNANSETRTLLVDPSALTREIDGWAIVSSFSFMVTSGGWVLMGEPFTMSQYSRIPSGFELGSGS